jgi:hypothetical protein
MPRSTTSPMDDVCCEHKNSSEKPHGTVQDLILKFSKHTFTGFDTADRRNSSSSSSSNNSNVREGSFSYRSSCSSTSTSSSPKICSSMCHTTNTVARSLSNTFNKNKKETGENPNVLKDNNIVHKEADHDDDDEVSIGNLTDFMTRQQHTTAEVVEGINGGEGERGSSVTFSESVYSFGIERIPECDHSKLFYTQEEIAQFQYEAFMESCGLDPKYMPP